MANQHLIIFAKPPRLGRAKRRLAKRIGLVPAWIFYRRMLGALVRRLATDSRWRCRLVIDKGAARWPRHLTLSHQSGGDLGARMENAFRCLPLGPALLIGSDIPDIRPEHINAAFKQLGDHDVVFGPAGDGGYWLIGFKNIHRHHAPFASVRWSTDQALEDTLKNMKGFKVAFCAQLDDVDD